MTELERNREPATTNQENPPPSDLIERYKKSKRLIKETELEFQKKKSRIEDKAKQWKDVVNKKINFYKNHLDQVNQWLIDKDHILYKNRDDECKRLHKDIAKIERIVKFLNFNQNEDLSLKIATKNFQEIDTFYEDEFLILKAYVYDSDWLCKVNKHSLGIAGKTIFSSVIGWKLLRHGGLSFSYKGNICPDIEYYLKRLPTIDELIAYYKRNKSKFLREFMELYFCLKEEYLNVVKAYTLDDFKELAYQLCENCGFYMLKYNYSYSRDEQCPRCHTTGVFKEAKLDGHKVIIE